LKNVLTTSELPSGVTWTQSSEGRLSQSEPNSAQRVWASQSAGEALEVDVVTLGSESEASAGYKTWLNGSGQTLASTTSTPDCSSGHPDNCDIRVGTSSSGKSEAILTYQVKEALVAIVLIKNSGQVDVNYLDQVGQAEARHLGDSLGG
jgi:hypothetical protein